MGDEKNQNGLNRGGESVILKANLRYRMRKARDRETSGTGKWMVEEELRKAQICGLTSPNSMLD